VGAIAARPRHDLREARSQGRRGEGLRRAERRYPRSRSRFVAFRIGRGGPGQAAVRRQHWSGHTVFPQHIEGAFCRRRHESPRGWKRGRGTGNGVAGDHRHVHPFGCWRMCMEKTSLKFVRASAVRGASNRHIRTRHSRGESPMWLTLWTPNADHKSCAAWFGNERGLPQAGNVFATVDDPCWTDRPILAGAELVHTAD